MQELWIPRPRPGLNVRHQGVTVLILDNLVILGLATVRDAGSVRALCCASCCLSESWQARAIVLLTWAVPARTNPNGVTEDTELCLGMEIAAVEAPDASELVFSD